MKILFLSHYSNLLGSNRSLESLVYYFSSHGFEVNVLLPSRGLFYDTLKANNIGVYVFKFFYETLYIKKNVKYLSLPILWFYNLLVFPFLLLKILSLKPDIIYSNSSADLYSVWIAKILRIKHIIHIREFMKEDFGAYCILGGTRKRSILLKSDKLIFVSNAVCESVVGKIPVNGKVIYNGLPIPLLFEKSRLNIERFKIGVVGNIDISKQQHLAIEYMSTIIKFFPNCSMVIVGDKECPYKSYIKSQVKKLGLDNYVDFAGFVKNIDDIYSKFDILLMCSRSEAFGRVTIEAMLRYKPVIGFNSGGTPELIDNGKNGYIFNNCEDVIQALNYLSDPVLYNSIIENARIRAVELFNDKLYAKNIFDFVSKF